MGNSEPPTKRGFDDFYGFVGGYGWTRGSRA